MGGIIADPGMPAFLPCSESNSPPSLPARALLGSTT
jgi:hypothetical protein